MLRGADCLRRSLVPSLLESRRVNESLANERIELFETAKVYLPTGKELPEEYWALAFTTGEDFRSAKGTLEAILERLHVTSSLTAEPYRDPFFEAGECCRVLLGDDLLGFLGSVSKKGKKACGLRKPTVVAELKLSVLEDHSQLIPQHGSLSQYPAINHDFNFVVDEKVRWSELSETVASSAGSLLESVDYQETYRDPERDGENRKRLLLSVRLRSHEDTLTGEQAEEVRGKIISNCESKHGAKLL